MMEYLTELDFWHWWILGLVLLVLEMLISGTFFLWMAVAAGIVGLLVLLIPDFSWQGQFLTFGAFSIVAIVAGRMWLRRNPIATDDSTLNRRGAQYVGRVLTLTESLVDGEGKHHLDDTVWKIATVDGSDVPAGGKVKVTGLDGTVLKVEPA